MEIFACIIAAISMVTVLLPFFVSMPREEERLQESSAVNSPEQLAKMQDLLIERYLSDEKAHKQGMLSQSVWSKRQEFLKSRYIDMAQRMEYLKQK